MSLLNKNIGLAEYIWIDANGNYRQKTTSLKKKLKKFQILKFGILMVQVQVKHLEKILKYI